MTGITNQTIPKPCQGFSLHATYELSKGNIWTIYEATGNYNHYIIRS
ncbi:hypothetical protein HMPREF9148_00106 [Prevotella sp. F0091]|nr:hypothetical protein HMPREF9148_00106 [Prevotella sp. F0091]